jgi:hypothetical protein
MRTITIYKYDELTEEAQKIALQEVEEKMRDSEWEDAQHWAIDDCALFEPKHEEMAAILGEDYYDRNLTPDGKYGQFVFKNNRKRIRYDNDQDWVNITEALEITNVPMFLKWLGIPEILHEYVSYEITGLRKTCSTGLELFHELNSDDPRATALEAIFSQAVDKFNSHMDDILQRIEEGTEAYFDEENVLNRIEESEYEFYENGEIAE